MKLKHHILLLALFLTACNGNNGLGSLSMMPNEGSDYEASKVYEFIQADTDYLLCETDDDAKPFSNLKEYKEFLQSDKNTANAPIKIDNSLVQVGRGKTYHCETIPADKNLPSHFEKGLHCLGADQEIVEFPNLAAFYEYLNGKGSLIKHAIVIDGQVVKSGRAASIECETLNKDEQKDEQKDESKDGDSKESGKDEKEEKEKAPRKPPDYTPITGCQGGCQNCPQHGQFYRDCERDPSPREGFCSDTITCYQRSRQQNGDPEEGAWRFRTQGCGMNLPIYSCTY